MEASTGELGLRLRLKLEWCCCCEAGTDAEGGTGDSCSGGGENCSGETGVHGWIHCAGLIEVVVVGEEREKRKKNKNKRRRSDGITSSSAERSGLSLAVERAIPFSLSASSSIHLPSYFFLHPLSTLLTTFSDLCESFRIIAEFIFLNAPLQVT